MPFANYPTGVHIVDINNPSSLAADPPPELGIKGLWSIEPQLEADSGLSFDRGNGDLSIEEPQQAYRPVSYGISTSNAMGTGVEYVTLGVQERTYRAVTSVYVQCSHCELLRCAQVISRCRASSPSSLPRIRTWKQQVRLLP